MRATQIDPSISKDFEDVPNLQKDESLCIVGTEFGNTKDKNLPYVLITLKDRTKRFTTGAKVIGQLKSDFYQKLINEAVAKNSGLDVLSETVKANIAPFRDMLSINIFKTS